MNFTMITSQFCLTFSTSCGPIGKFEVARTYQSYRASLTLAYSDALGALLVCTLLPGALDSYRDRINSQNGIYVGLSAVNISLTVQIFIPGFLQTIMLTSTLTFLGPPCGCFRHHSLQYLSYTVSNLIAICLFSFGIQSL